MTIPYQDEEISVQRFNEGKSLSPPVLLIHGAIENGKIFYSKSGKGLAPYLAKKGLDVYVVDLRGRGKSTPPVSRNSRISQTETIYHELPTIIAKIKEVAGSDSIQIGAHSWGGVLTLATFALHAEELNIKNMVFFGTKRRISIRNFQKFFTVDLVWTFFGNILTSIYGYLPAVKYKFGSDNEPARFYRQENKWVYSKKWIDSETKVDYGQKLKALKHPPTYFFTGENDKLLGNPIDVQKLAAECGGTGEVIILSKENGNLQDYDHISILTSKDAENDHFIEVAKIFCS